jgi:DNA-binding transcriptional ArsR family regulator
MENQAPPRLFDPRLVAAMSHPIRVQILGLLTEGPSSPARMQRLMENVSLNLVSHHVKVLRDLGCIELIEVVKTRGAQEHIYRARKHPYLTAEEWEAMDPIERHPITATILRTISEDTGRSLAEGRFEERADNHLSRSPVELDEQGWGEVVTSLARALDEVLEAHARSAERAQASGEELMVARVVMMQYPIGRMEVSEEKASGNQ